jgi:hypothetical protein
VANIRQRPESRDPLRPVALAASRSVCPPSLNTRCGESLGLLREGDQEGIAFNHHYLCDGVVLFKHPCALECWKRAFVRLSNGFGLTSSFSIHS